MRNKLYFATLLLGVAIGVYGAADYFKTKYRTLAETEIESVRKAFYEERAQKNVEKKKESRKSVSSLDEFSSIAQEDIPERAKMDDLIAENKYDAKPAPYVISPDDFGATFEYDCISLVYYSDGVLVDDNQNVIKDIDGTIGPDALDHIGQYEDDSVHVRNDTLRCDYEILLDDRKWADVRQKWVR